MKNVLSLFLFVFFTKYTIAMSLDVNRAKAQSPYISQGTSVNTAGDIPAMADSVWQLGSPFMNFIQVFVRSEKQRYYAFDGAWFPVTAVDPTRVKYTDTALMLAPYAQNAALTAGLATKFNTPSGSTSQYIRGDGSLATLPAPGVGTVTSVGLSSSDFSISGSPITESGNITANLSTTGITAGTYGRITVDSKGRATAGKRQEVYSGTTNATGEYTVTFGSSYSATPNIQANLVGGTANQTMIITSVSTTGFTVKAVQRSAVTLLGIEVLLAATTNVNGANIDVIITEK